MGLVPGWKDLFIALQVLFALGIFMYAGAYICEVGREKDKTGEWRWVLPHANPCGCHKVVMGGVNTRTPIRPFEPKYVDSPLISEDIDEIRKHYKIECNAVWSGFGDWDSCTTTCGNGSQSRGAICVIPEFTHTSCEGTPPIETRKCNNSECPTWGTWGTWGECSTTCDNGTQYRNKKCNKYGHQTAQCNGTQPEENQDCSWGKCPTWGAWETWGACSTTCDNGTQYRKKKCNKYGHPTAQCNGTQPEENQECNEGTCPYWSIWNPWSEWDFKNVTDCQLGRRHRYRMCDNSSFPDVPCPAYSPMEHQCCNSPDGTRSCRKVDDYFIVYQLFKETKKYDQARDACAEQNATLTSIVDQKEQDFLKEFLQDVSGNVWIGLNDKAEEKKWVWEDGTQFNYTYWNTNEPNNSGNEDCAHLIRSSDKRWNDHKCSETFMYICKMPLYDNVNQST